MPTISEALVCIQYTGSHSPFLKNEWTGAYCFSVQGGIAGLASLECKLLRTCRALASRGQKEHPLKKVHVYARSKSKGQLICLTQKRTMFSPLRPDGLRSSIVWTLQTVQEHSHPALIILSNEGTEAVPRIQELLPS